jgi:hypothetical protein
VTSGAENQYRKLARDFHLMALDLPPGEERSALLKMAEAWDRLADQQEQATDSKKKNSRLY